MMESIYRSASHAGAPLLQSRQDAPPSLAPPGVIPNYIDPPTIGNQIVVASMTPIGFAIIFVTLRLLIKWRVIKRLGWDDFLISLALEQLLAIARAIVSTINAKRFGLGRHIWDINPQDLVGEESQKNLTFIADMLYLVGIMCTKLAIMLLYLQLFRINRVFRYLCFTMMGFVISYCVIFFFIEAFNCNPVAKVWHGLTYVGKYSCFDNSMVEFVIGGFNISTDFVILVMPVPLILGLQLDLKHKLGLLVVFATGIFVWATTIVREVIVVQTLRDFDQSWSTVPETIWLTIELDVGIICACLPTVLASVRNRHLLGRLIPESLRSLLRRSGLRSSQSSSKVSSKRVGHQRSESGVELVDTGKVNTHVHANMPSVQPWRHKPNTIMRQTDMDINYSGHTDASNQV